MIPENKSQRLSDLLHGFAAVIGVCFFYLGSMTLASALWQMSFLSNSGGVFSEAEYLEAFNRASGYINLIFSAACLLLAALFYKLRRRSLVQAANILPAKPSKVVAALAAGLGAQLPISYIVMFIPFPESVFQNHGELMSASTTPMVLQILYAVILAPVIEEIFFRGIAHDRLARAMNPIAAAVLSSASFALIHGELLSIIVAFAAGMLLALLYNRYKTVLVPIAFHVGFNAFSYGTAFIKGETAVLVATGVSAAVLAVSLVFLFRRGKKNTDNTTEIN